jgi:hypothetical protein
VEEASSLPQATSVLGQLIEDLVDQRRVKRVKSKEYYTTPV